MKRQCIQPPIAIVAAYKVLLQIDDVLTGTRVMDRVWRERQEECH